MKLVVFVVALAMGCYMAFGQTIRISEHSLVRRDSDQSVQQAVEVVKTCLSRFNISVSSNASIRASLAKTTVGPPDSRYWALSIPSADTLAIVDSRTGVLTGLSSIDLQVKRSKRLGRTGRTCFSSKEQAKELAINASRNLGVPSSWRAVDFIIRGDGVENCGVISCRFRNSSGRVVGTIALDSQDGKMIAFSRKEL